MRNSGLGTSWRNRTTFEEDFQCQANAWVGLPIMTLFEGQVRYDLEHNPIACEAAAVTHEQRGNSG